MPSTSVLVEDAIDEFGFLSDVHVVGGAVRDAVIGRKSDDIDLATSDEPGVVREKCEYEGMTVIETGIDHGTVTAICGSGKFEITTFRRDVSTDGRNATVEFADSIEEDLSRRDFTINAMAFDGDELVDPFDGRGDLQRGLIRTVGDPEHRFREDFLRVIRALRFASRFGFTIGDEEREVMREVAPEVIENVSVERVFMEIEKALRDERPSRFFGGMSELGIFEDIFGEAVGHMPMIELEAVTDRLVAFVVVIHRDTGLDFDEIQDALKLPNGLLRDAGRTSKLLNSLRIGMSETERRKALADFADVRGFARRIGTRVLGRIPELFEEPEDVPLQPVLSGQDLLDAGFEEGPEIGDLLDEAHRIQLSEGITDEDVLISRLS